MSDAGGDITPQSIVVASSDQVSSDLAGETVLLSMQTAHYYGLDGVGSRVWELVKEPVRVSDICAAIASEYDVSADTCQADVIAFLRDLAAKNLVEVRVGA
ncbi:MAG TPA: lasso peptide biosynthesis PqqD family chaperone [Gemmatimonadaceae bacterium]|nr:lasso peptide biosynthesis PqqD family chaperone [Gemmatimonadaceae bacterium]